MVLGCVFTVVADTGSASKYVVEVTALIQTRVISSSVHKIASKCEVVEETVLRQTWSDRRTSSCSYSVHRDKIGKQVCCQCDGAAHRQTHIISHSVHNIGKQVCCRGDGARTEAHYQSQFTPDRQASMMLRRRRLDRRTSSVIVYTSLASKYVVEETAIKQTHVISHSVHKIGKQVCCRGMALRQTHAISYGLHEIGKQVGCRRDDAQTDARHES
jgi:hypothetical protein